ncbi:hypothetical protein B0H14DRAFT_2595661 [Mycena olivaceomarginata]|nr:hypothetical protein B0H14DRAFT_2595661 [Mycena olivaceomarginata]
MHHHAKQVILIAAGSGIVPVVTGCRARSPLKHNRNRRRCTMICLRIGVLTLEWVFLESYTDWIGRTNPFRAPGNEVLRGDVDVLDLPSGIQWAAVAGHAYTHAAIFIELLKAPRTYQINSMCSGSRLIFRRFNSNVTQSTFVSLLKPWFSRLYWFMDASSSLYQSSSIDSQISFTRACGCGR